MRRITEKLKKVKQTKKKKVQIKFPDNQVGGWRTCVGTVKPDGWWLKRARGRKGEEEERGRESEGVILSWPVCVAVARSRAHKGSRVLYHGPEIVSFAVIYAGFSLDLLQTDRSK